MDMQKFAGALRALSGKDKPKSGKDGAFMQLMKKKFGKKDDADDETKIISEIPNNPIKPLVSDESEEMKRKRMNRFNSIA